MKTTLRVQDIRQLLQKAKNVVALGKSADIKDISSNLKDLIEMFELVFLRIESLEMEAQKQNKDLDLDLKKLRREMDRVKVVAGAKK